MPLNNKEILSCFPLLASVLGAKYGVEIRMTGDKAMTDGQIIYLPKMPSELDNEMLMTAKAYIDHESAHIRFTDFDKLKLARLPFLESWIFNAIEDWRVERKLGQIYPGCEQNFREQIKRMFAKVTGTGQKNPVLVILDYILLYARSWSVREIGQNRDEKGKIIEDNFTGLKDELDRILSVIPEKCETTETSIDYAMALGDCIRKFIPVQNNHKRHTASQKNSGSRQIASEKPEKYNKDHEKGGKKFVPDSSILDSSFSTVTQSNDKSLFRMEDIKTETTTSTEFESESDRTLATAAKELPQNFGDLLADSLNNMQQIQGEVKIEIACVGHKETKPYPPEEKREALQTSVAMRNRLAGLLQSKILSRNNIGRHGKLVSSKLHRVYVGKPQIFMHESIKIGLNVALHILLDCSSSMYGANMEMAQKACYAIFKCLSAIGDTPLGPALWWVMTDMLKLKENRKIILVITDGIPNCYKSASRAIGQCGKIGIEVYGLGIQTRAISHLLPKTSKVIQDIGQLAPAFFELLKESLLEGLRK